MNTPLLRELIGNTDIYLLDQILKNRYAATDKILDAGAGSGRNLHWFIQNGISAFGTDRDPQAVEELKRRYPVVPEDHFLVAPMEKMPFENHFFDHVLCCAVLHFAENPAHFEAMFAEIIRVLKPGGSMFLRVATDIGIAEKMQPLGNGRYTMPDGTDRFLLTRNLLNRMVYQHTLTWLEPMKIVNVNDLRSMTVLVLQKT